MRPVAEDMYAIPPERIIGSALGISYSSEGAQPALMYKGAMDFFDDGPEKPVRIWSRIGRRPILAFGNSNGDVPMLAYAGTDATRAFTTWRAMSGTGTPTATPLRSTSPAVSRAIHEAGQSRQLRQTATTVSRASEGDQ